MSLRITRKSEFMRSVTDRPGEGREALLTRILVPGLLLCLVLSIACEVRAQPFQEEWTPVFNLSDSSGSAQYSAITVDRAGNLHVVWVDREDPAGELGESPTGSALFYARWDGEGWTTPHDVLAGGIFNRVVLGLNPVDDSLHAIWSAWPNLRHSSAYVAGRPEYPAAWSMPTEIQDVAAEGGTAPDIAIASDGTIHVVWVARPLVNTPSEVLYSHSTDNGMTWSHSIALSGTPKESINPRVAVGLEGEVYAVWEEGTSPDVGTVIHYTRSRDGGRTWDPPRRLNDYSAGYVNISVSPDGRVIVSWVILDAGISRRGRELIVSADGGDSWTGPVAFPHGDAYGYSYRPAEVAFDSMGRAHFLFFDYEAEQFGLFHIMWTGNEWGSGIRIADVRQLEHVRARIAITRGNQVHAIWAGGASQNTYQIYTSRSQTDAPAIPSEPVKSVPIPSPVATPTLTVTAVPSPSPTRQAETMPVPSVAKVVSRPDPNTSIIVGIIASGVLIGLVIFVQRVRSRM